MPCDTVANWHRPRIHQLHERSQFSSPTTSRPPARCFLIATSAPLMIINLRFADRHIPVFMPPNYPSTASPAPCSWRRSAGPSSRIPVTAWDRVDYHFFMKLAAVRSGLAQYGRNNICYVEGMGSFFHSTPT